MLHISENYPLNNLNTFGVKATAKWFVQIDNEEDLQQIFAESQWNYTDRLLLGGGSNVLLTRDFPGLVIRMNIKGIKHEIQDEMVLVSAGAGVVWNDLVNYCVDREFAGIENLSLIPGSVGASPIQNIGAYGVELKDVFHSCKAFEISTGKILTFTRSDCKFGYRDSIFKNELKGKVIITDVTYKLSTRPNLNTSYGAIQQELQKRGIERPTIKDISKVVSEIRVNKLPDPSTIGNAGSFFKNPIITVDNFRHLQYTFPDIVHFPVGNGKEKIAAGWLIEKCGWKGRKIGETGTWKNQALVLVNYGNATGSAIYDLSSLIISDVKKQFDIELEREVNII
jgi:UDP-N-acetylmuramate dehydrogenase